MTGCTACGAANRPGITFCEACGTPLAQTAPPPPGQPCPSCGAPNRTGITFCEACGTPLAQTAPPPPGQPCPSCGLPNRTGITFCEECGHHLAAPPAIQEPAPGTDRPARRWIGAAAAALVLGGLGVGGWLIFKPDTAAPPAFDVDSAGEISDQIVTEGFPAYSGVAGETVELGDGRFVTGYHIPTDPGAGQPFDRYLNVYIDPETDSVTIEESN